MKKIVKEHRVLDATDLNNINNTFKDIKNDINNTFKEIKHDMNNTFKEIKHDMNNNFIRIDNTFKLIEKTCESMNTRMNSLEKSADDKHKTLVVLISIVGIVLTILKVFY